MFEILKNTLVRAEETSDDMYRPQRVLIGIFIQHPDNEISIIEEISLHDLGLVVMSSSQLIW